MRCVASGGPGRMIGSGSVYEERQPERRCTAGACETNPPPRRLGAPLPGGRGICAQRSRSSLANRVDNRTRV